MAVTTWTAGEVLAAADLNDTFASKPTFTYGTATPTADADGAIWYDENDTPPTPKFWDGSAWQPFSSGIGAAAISSPAATGQYTDSGITYDYFVFNSSGTLTVDDAGDGVGGFVDVLIIGGGGAGGYGGVQTGAGGGGAGGYFEEYVYLPAGTATVTVGAGGAGATTQYGSNGNESHLDSYLAVGGGGGAGGDSGVSGAAYAGLKGGSGGGGGHWNFNGTRTGASGTLTQGNAGGDVIATGGGRYGSGGGGAGAAGANASTSSSDGGNGLASSITGSSVTRGGGGGGGVKTPVTSGGTGGGGAGNNSGTNATSGTANTGGGGGGAGGASFTPGNSGSGGSGVVIVRVAV